MMKSDPEHINVNAFIEGFLQDKLRTTFNNKGMYSLILKAISDQKKALKKRCQWKEQGIHVPPFMIVSVSNQCNLECKGCYFYAQNRVMENEMSEKMFNSILNEARELGISIVFIAGGEPLIRRNLLKITAKYPEIIFLLFSNGLLVNDEVVEILRKQKHVIPIISLEGYAYETDKRRGVGVFKRLIQIIETMKYKEVFFGISLTVTRDNFTVIFNDQYIEQFVNAGCKIFFFVEYISVQKGTDDLLMTDNQKSEIPNLITSYRLNYPALFIAFPEEEKKFGGCLSARGGLIHISPGGAIEPCPFVPYSDVDLNYLSLKEALRSSKLLNTIRENYDILRELEKGCVLWKNREWIDAEKNNHFYV